MTHENRSTVLHVRVLMPVVAVLSLSACASAPPSASDQQRIAGKTFVITGASSGFGRGVALKLAENRANVVLAARRTNVLNDVARQAEAAGGQALVVTTDVSRPEDVEALAQAAVGRFGRIDVWINDAGVGTIGRFWDVPVADQARVVDVNLKGVIYGSHAAIRQFRTQGYGTLVNIGSVESRIPLAYHATYGATKYAVLGLGRALNEELRLDGRARTIKVATVMPWAVDTPFWRHAANYSGGTPRMAAMDGPDKVVNAIIHASLHPKEEQPVGWKAGAASLSHAILPDLTESLSADIIHNYQIETAPPAPPTAGAVHQPMEAGQGVDDGVRARIEAENETREASQP